MASLKTARQLADDADIMARSYEFVNYMGFIYAPVDYETGVHDPIPSSDRMAWVPLSQQDLEHRAQDQFDTMFATPKELADFYYKVLQVSRRVPQVMPDKLLVKTTKGLRALTADGTLVEPTGEFVPNLLSPVLNEDEAMKQELFDVMVQWLDAPAEAVSLLRHMATALAPSWSSGKYVLAIGSGSNGKSLCIDMLVKLLGGHNCSSVTRQHIAADSPVQLDLNGKLLNYVMDGEATFVKDSGREKSLITGEDISVRRLYASTNTKVQTNALFIEGLNLEPRTSDKSAALQRRLVRFHFPNRFPADPMFAEKMTSEPMLGAFLSLLLDHFVRKNEVAVMLAPTQRSRELQLEHMEENSLALQYVLHVDDTDPLGADVLIGMSMDDLCAGFTSWRFKMNDMTAWDSVGIQRLFRPVVTTKRTSVRANKQVRSKRIITGFTQETTELLAMQKEEAYDDAALVED